MSVIFLCNTLVFLTLLTDKYKVWTTALIYGLAFFASLLLAPLAQVFVKDPVVVEILKLAINLLVLFGVSLFISADNPLHKVFLAILCLSNYGFVTFFVQILLGALPFKTAGASSAVFAILVYVLFTLLIGLALKKPLEYFSDRAPSGFMGGATVLAALPFALSFGKADVVFRYAPNYFRILLSLLIYVLLVFVIRSAYYAAKFKVEVIQIDNKDRLVKLQKQHYASVLESIAQLQQNHNKHEYLLDVISVLAKDGNTEQIPAYISMQKKMQPASDLLKKYADDPELNAVLASMAHFAKSHGITFECNVLPGGKLKSEELCMITHEMLSKACDETMQYGRDKKRIRFTLTPGKKNITIEVVYSALAETKRKVVLSEKSFSQVLDYLFEDPTEELEEAGLSNTEALVNKYSGKMSVSTAGASTILTVLVNQ